MREEGRSDTGARAALHACWPAAAEAHFMSALLTLDAYGCCYSSRHAPATQHVSDEQAERDMEKLLCEEDADENAQPAAAATAASSKPSSRAAAAAASSGHVPARDKWNRMQAAAAAVEAMDPGELSPLSPPSPMDPSKRQPLEKEFSGVSLPGESEPVYRPSVVKNYYEQQLADYKQRFENLQREKDAQGQTISELEKQLDRLQGMPDASAPKTRLHVANMLLRFARYSSPAHRKARRKQLINAQAAVETQQTAWVEQLQLLSKVRARAALLEKQCAIDDRMTAADDEDAIAAQAAGEELLERAEQLKADAAQVRQGSQQNKKARHAVARQAIAVSANFLYDSADAEAIRGSALQELKSGPKPQPAGQLRLGAFDAAASAAAPATHKRRRNEFLDDEAAEAGSEEEEKDEEEEKESN